ncbi:MAG: HAD family hydrolase [Spirochaetales bacterium]
MKQYTTVVFDLGGVLVDINGDFAPSLLSRILAIPTSEIVGLLSELEEPFETGRLDEDAAIASLLDAAEGSTERGGWESEAARERAGRLVRSSFAGRFAPIPENIELVHELAGRGVRLALASNTSTIDLRAVERSFPDALAPFAHRFLSYEIGAMKPAVEFYTAVLSRLRQPAEQCLFVDDKPENVRAARRCGLGGIIYQEPDQLREDLFSRLDIA